MASIAFSEAQPFATEAKLDLRAGGEGDGVAARAREAGQDHLVIAEPGPVGIDLLLGGDVVLAVLKAPALDQRIDRQLQRAAALLVHRVGGRQHLGHLRGDDHVLPLRVVDRVGVAGGQIGIAHAVHRLDHALRGAQPGLGLLAVGGQGHRGVHGEDLALLHARFAAAGERKQREQAQRQAEDAFIKVFLSVHVITVIMKCCCHCTIREEK